MTITVQVDPHVLAVLPNVDDILAISSVGASAWAKAFRISVRHSDGAEEDYFMKISIGYHGREALKGEFEATSAMYTATPEFCPQPIAWGTFQHDPESHFYICKFYEFFEGVPAAESLCEKLAQLHLNGKSPNGKFGFHCVTYNGDLPQNNDWQESWETFFANGMRHVLNIREERAGADKELDGLLPALFEKVIPRLLRPLESHGRSVEPALVHGDLWYGNSSIVDQDSSEGIVYDPASFYAHNEYELGNWRPGRNRFGSEYFQEYQRHINQAVPEEDFDDRNALYALRFNMHAATLFPDDKKYLYMVVEDLRGLVARYPNGYEGQ